MKKQYANLAEIWFDQHYQPLTLINILISWWKGIDTRKSAVINFGKYLENN